MNLGPKVFDVKLAHIVPDQVQVVAKKKLRLVFEFREATTLYSSCVAAIAEFAGGTLLRAEFDRLNRVRQPVPTSRAWKRVSASINT